MLYTTKTLLHSHGACPGSYHKFFRAVGREIADDEPIGLNEICRVNGILDALWCLRATTEPCERFARALACDFFARGEASAQELSDAAARAANAAAAARAAAAAYAAYAAAYAADAADAAANAAYAADDAYNAEREWQTAHFLTALEGRI